MSCGQLNEVRPENGNATDTDLQRTAVATQIVKMNGSIERNHAPWVHVRIHHRAGGTTTTDAGDAGSWATAVSAELIIEAGARTKSGVKLTYHGERCIIFARSGTVTYIEASIAGKQKESLSSALCIER
jgi:hypothetical protein